MRDYSTNISPEEYVILALLNDPGDFMEKLLKTPPEYFPHYQDIFHRLQNAFRSGGVEKAEEEAVEILSKDKRLLSLNDGFDPSFLAVEANLNILEERYKKRVLEQLIDEYKKGKISLEELTEHIKDIRLKINEKRWAFTLNDEKEELLEDDKEEPLIIPFVNVKSYPSDLILITAQTKSGKTTLAMNMLLSLMKTEETFDPEEAKFSPKKALYVTYEVPKKKLFRMLVGMEKGKNWEDVDQEDKESFLDRYGNSLSIKESMSLEDLLDFLWLFHPDVFVVDYDQLVPTKGRFESEERRLAYIIRSLKDVATQIGSIGIILSQVNEDGKARYSREKEHAASIHIHLEKQENSDEITYEIKLNRWGVSGTEGILKVDWSTRKVRKPESRPDTIVG